MSAPVSPARLSDRLYFDADIAFKRRDDWIIYRGGRQFGAFDAYDIKPTVDVNWFIQANHQIDFSFQGRPSRPMKMASTKRTLVAMSSNCWVEAMLLITLPLVC